MKTYKSRDLTHKRAEVFAEARKGPVIINQCRTHGAIIEMFVLTHQPAMSEDEVKRVMGEINKKLVHVINIKEMIIKILICTVCFIS